MPLRLLDPVERDLKNDPRLDQVHGAVACACHLLKMLRELIDFDVRKAGIRLPDVDELLVATHCKGVVGQNAATLAVSVLGGGDDAVEGRERFLVFQPRLAAAAGRVDRSRILHDQALVRARAGGVEQLVDVGCIADGSLIGEPDCAALHDLAQTREAFAERQLEECFAVFEEEIECEKRHRRIAQQLRGHLAAAEAGLDYGEGEDAIAERDDLAVEDDAVVESKRRGRA